MFANPTQHLLLITQSGGGAALEFVIPATAVPSDQAVYTGYIDFADIRIQGAAGFLANCIDGAGNVQVWNDSKTQQLARHVHVEIDLSAGQIWYRCENASSTVDNRFYLFPDPAQLADYAVTDTYGRNNTFQEYINVMDFEDPIASSLTSLYNGRTFVRDTYGAIVNQYSTGPIGQEWAIETYSSKQQNIHVQFPFSQLGTNEVTAAAWAKVDAQPPNQFAGFYIGILLSTGAYSGSNPGYGIAVNYDSNAGQWYFQSQVRSTNVASVTHYVGYDAKTDWHHVAMIYNKTTQTNTLMVDGVNVGSISTSSVDNNILDQGLTFFSRPQSGYDFPTIGRQCWNYVRYNAVNEDYITMEHKNQSDTAFYSSITEVNF